MFLKLGWAQAMPGPARKIVSLVEGLQAAAHFPSRERDGSICRKKAQHPSDRRPGRFLQDRRLLQGKLRKAPPGAFRCGRFARRSSAVFQRLGGRQEHSRVIFVGGLRRGLAELPGHFQQIRRALRFPECYHLLKTVDRRRGFAPARRRGVIENGGLPLLVRRVSIRDTGWASWRGNAGVLCHFDLGLKRSSGWPGNTRFRPCRNRLRSR